MRVGCGRRACVTDGRAGRKRGRRRLGAAVRGGGQRDERARRGPLKHARGLRTLAPRRGPQRRDHPRITGRLHAPVRGRRDPRLRAFLKVRQKSEPGAVGGPHEIADEDAVRQLHIGVGAFAERIEAEAVEAVDVQVPGPVRAGPDLEHREAQRLFADLLQRRKLGRERDHEVVPVRAHVVERRVVGVGGEEVLDGLAGQDVALLDVELQRGVGGGLGGGVLCGQRCREDGQGGQQQRGDGGAEAAEGRHAGLLGRGGRGGGGKLERGVGDGKRLGRRLETATGAASAPSRHQSRFPLDARCRTFPLNRATSYGDTSGTGMNASKACNRPSPRMIRTRFSVPTLCPASSRSMVRGLTPESVARSFTRRFCWRRSIFSRAPTSRSTSCL